MSPLPSFPLVRWAAAAALAASVAHGAGAQAPVITPAGDPSVRNDTIYRLAVDPKAYPEEQVHWILDDGVVRIERDGRVTRTYRQVMQILTEPGAQNEREREYSYVPGRQRFRINWMRVVKPDGTVMSAAPTHQQESDIAPPVSADPVYAEGKVIRMSLSGVEPGTLVDASYTTEDTLPALTGDVLDAWRITPGVRIERSRYVVDAPAGMPLRIQERNLTFKRTEHTAGGRTTYVWATREVPKIEGEPYAADSTNTVLQSVTIGGPTTWDDVGRWYAGLARDRYAMSPALTKKVAGLVATARTRADTVRAVQRWVAQDVRYVGIELGRGGYQPRSPDSVSTTGYGDCKDKATLFVAALRSLGITAYPVLLHAGTGAAREFPGAEQFNHAIAVVPQPGGGRDFVDLTAAYYPYGVLPGPDQGGFALVVHPDGTSEPITIPRAAVDNRVRQMLTGTLSPDGTFTGTQEMRFEGPDAHALRVAFANPLDSATRATFAQRAAQEAFPRGDGDSLVAFNGKDFSQPVAMRIRVKAPDAAQVAGHLLLLHLPIAGPGPPTEDDRRQLLATPRRFPIDIAAVSAPGVSDAEFRVTLPEGWKAQLPSDVVVGPGPFGTYEVHYAQHGRELVVTKHRAGARGILPPERVKDVATWLDAIGKDDAKFIVLERPAGGRE